PVVGEQPSVTANRKHCCCLLMRTRSESGMPLAFVVRIERSFLRRRIAWKHCGSGLNVRLPWKRMLPQSFTPFVPSDGQLWAPICHELPENVRLNTPAYIS